jgi:hypothetical protein
MPFQVEARNMQLFFMDFVGGDVVNDLLRCASILQEARLG